MAVGQKDRIDTTNFVLSEDPERLKVDRRTQFCASGANVFPVTFEAYLLPKRFSDINNDCSVEVRGISMSIDNPS
jgi:hypothetical protein